MPQPFKTAVITNSGVNMLIRAQAGEAKIEFTRIATGDGIYAEDEKDIENLQQRKVLKSEKNRYGISGAYIHSDKSIKMTALITNQDPVTKEVLITEGYYINEIGLYAKESGETDDKEVLYSIAVTSGTNGDFMPAYNGFSPAEIIQEYYATVNNSAEVIIQSNTGASALMDDLNKVVKDLSDHTSDKTAHITNGHVTGKLTADVLGTSNHIVSVNNATLVMDSANDITELENIEDIYNGLVDFRYSHKGPIALQLPAIWLQDETTEVQLTVTVLSRNTNARFDFYIGFTVHMEQEAGSGNYYCDYDHFTAYCNGNSKAASYLSELPITYGSIKSPSSPIPLIWIGESDISKLTDWGLGTVAYVHDILVNTPETGIGMGSEWNKSFKIFNAYSLMQTLGEQAGELIDAGVSIRNTNASPREDSYIKVVRDFDAYPGLEHDMLKNTFFTGNIDLSDETGYIDYSHAYVGNLQAALTLESTGNDFVQFAFRDYDPHRSSLFFRSGRRGSADNKYRWRSLDKVDPFILFDGSANVINLSSDSLQWTHSFNVQNGGYNRFDIMREYIIPYGDELVEVKDPGSPNDSLALAFDFGTRFGLHFKILMDVCSAHPSYDTARYYLQTTDFDLIMRRDCGGYCGTKLLDVINGYGSHKTMEFKLEIFVYNSYVTTFNVTIGAPSGTGSQFYNEFGNILAYLEYLAIVQDR